jgi:hypothetical protein
VNLHSKPNKYAPATDLLRCEQFIHVASQLNTVSAIKKRLGEKKVRFLAIFHGGLKCCFCVLNYWITFKKGLSNWDKVKIKQQEHTGLSAKT